MSGNNLYEIAYEDIIDLYQKAECSFKEQRIQQAAQYLQRALEIKPPYPKIYLLKIECDLLLKNPEQASIVCSQAFDILENPRYQVAQSIHHRLDLLYAQFKIHCEMLNLEKALEGAENLQELLKKMLDEMTISQNSYNQAKSKIQEEAEDFRRKVSEQNRKAQSDTNLEEAKTVLQILQNPEENSYFRKEGSLVHLMSARWFEKWKKYVGFYQLTGDSAGDQLDLLNDETKGNCSIGEKEHPGPIDSTEIIDHTDFLIDDDKSKEYCNYQVRLGLQENKDFTIVSDRLWNYLYQKYGGFDIKRYVIRVNDKTSETAVEIWLKRINVLQLPPIAFSQNFLDCKLNTLFLSKRECVNDLKEKLTRIYKSNTKIFPKVNISSCKLWKLDPQYNYNEAILKVQNLQGRVIIKAVQLSEKTILEDAQIGDDDVIICEYKINDEWSFISESEYQKIISSKCASCGALKNDLLLCECRAVKYCSQTCQKNHWKVHRVKCVQIKEENNRENEVYKQLKISKDGKFTPTSRYGLVGLQNFGNTCFMNTCLQCLSNVRELTNYFITNEFIKDLNVNNKLGTGGRLAAAYGELMKELWYGSEPSISPWDIKRIIGQVASQFMGYNQQDTQEFLSYLLDGIHEDLNRVKDKPYVEIKDHADRPDQVFAAESWDNHLKRNKSIVVDLMHGQYKSRLVCPDCNKVSITFDPFSSLSLPIPTYKIVSLPLYFIYKDSISQPHPKISLNLPQNALVPEILQNLSKILNLPQESMELKLLRDLKITENETSRLDVKSLKESTGTLFVYQIHSPLVDPPLKTFDRTKLLRVEVLIDQEVGENSRSDIKSFCRLLYVDKLQTLKHLHLQIFTIMKAHIVNLLNNEEKIKQKIDVAFENGTIDLLEKKYEEILTLSQVDLLPYTLYFTIKEETGETARILIPYSSERKITDFFPLTQKNSLVIELTINSKTKLDFFKLNKCKEIDTTNQVANQPKSYTIYDCFNLFMTPEVLDKENTWYCSNCKDHKQATKTMELFMTPKILIIHLKRFRTNKVSSIGTFFFTSSSSKITSLIEYPIEGLDLRNYVRGKFDKEPIYDLFAISNHYGGMGGGHYTAYCKNLKKNAWYDFNDSSVTKHDADDLQTSAAYVLFYRRRE